MSRNALTIEQINLACRHVMELQKAGVTENFAIRTLELFTDTYAKLLNGGSASPHSVNQVKLWSIAALKEKENNPTAKPKGRFIVEHGTPRRTFARKVLALYRAKNLSKRYDGSVGSSLLETSRDHQR